MALTYGFYNSLNGDRKYNAEDFAAIFNGIINDGVFLSVGTAFIVEANEELMVDVGVGRAWFNGTWTYNDSILTLTLGDSDLVYDRIDAVVLEVNRTSRVNDIKILQGEAQTNPVNPTLTKTTYVKQYPLCYIYRKANSTSIAQADITNMVGTSETPFVTGILETLNTDVLIGQWASELEIWFQNKKIEYDNWLALTQGDYDAWVLEKQGDYDAWVAEKQADFLSWYERMKNQLDEDAAGSLQTQMDEQFKLNRGYVANKVTFNNDGSISTEYTDFSETTVFNEDGSISSTLTHNDGRVFNKTTTFNKDGSIQTDVT